MEMTLVVEVLVQKYRDGQRCFTAGISVLCDVVSSEPTLYHTITAYVEHNCGLGFNCLLYDPSGDSKAAGDPYCTLFVGQLSLLTKEDTIRETMSKYGKIKTLHLVRHISK